MHGTTSRRSRRRGAVVIVILGMIILLSSLLAAFISRTGGDLLVADRNNAESRLRREAYSALETTLAVLAEFKAADGALHSPAQGWGDPLGYAGLEPSPGLQVGITFEDETGKLSLPGADSEAVRGLLEALGVEPVRAAGAARSLQAWRQQDERGTGRLRTFAEWAALEGWRELVADADGMPNDVWRRFEQAASPHRFGGTNLNTASAASLRALGWTEAQIGAWTRWRAGNLRTAGFARDWTDLTAQLGGTLPAVPLGTQVEVLRVMVAVHSGPLVYRVEAVVSPGVEAHSSDTGPDLCYPFRILEFHEDADLRAVPEDSP